jgi:hypothetical protein
MGQVWLARLDNASSFAPLRESFERDNPGLKLDLVSVSGQARLRSKQGGMRVFWIYCGEGEVFLPKGYRTQEGDGEVLPAAYQPEPMEAELPEKLNQLRWGLASLSSTAIVPARAILNRQRNNAFVGDISGDLWKLDHLPRPWSSEASIDDLLLSLYRGYRHIGHSIKQVDSFEPVMQGDQLIACGAEELCVRGTFRCLTMENIGRNNSHVSAARRLRYLADTAGGCNPDFDPFRRLPLTWFYNYPGESADGLNWVNSHVVNIPKETSPTHFHPVRGIGPEGGTAQREMYLVLDPTSYRLNTWGRQAELLVFPDLRNLRAYQRLVLEPGMFVYIPPGTGHRGLDVFVNVLTIPGFKPHNEYYIDRDIRDLTGAESPYNPNLLDSRNYALLEDMVEPDQP